MADICSGDNVTVLADEPDAELVSPFCVFTVAAFGIRPASGIGVTSRSNSIEVCLVDCVDSLLVVRPNRAG